MIQTQTIFVILFYGTLVTAVWNAPSEKNPSHTCGLRRLHIDDLLAKESTTFHHSLLERLHTIDTPVVIEGALSSWSALEKWSNQSYFLDTFGHLLLPRNSVTNTSLDVAQGLLTSPVNSQHCILLTVTDPLNSEILFM